LRINDFETDPKLKYSNREIYVFPTDIIIKYRGNDNWNKCFIKKIPDFLKYKDNWDIIKKKIE